MNMPQFTYTREIRNAVLIVHGEKTHSCYFSQDAYAAMVKDSKYTANKELMIIPARCTQICMTRWTSFPLISWRNTSRSI